MGSNHPLISRINEYLVGLRNHRRLSPSTLSLYKRDLNKLMDLAYTPNREILLRHLSKLAPATHVRKLIVWRAFLKTCPSPWRELLDKIPLPKVRRSETLFLTDEEAFRLENACYRSPQISRDRLIIGFGLQLGLRLSEITRLRFSDIEGEWIKIHRKGGKHQRLPLNPSLKALIEFWKLEKKPEPMDFIFSGLNHSSLSPRTIQKIVSRLAQSAGIKKRISPHSLRHTFATHLAAKGASLPALKELLGHERLATTERYLHITPEYLKETLSLLNRSFLSNNTRITEELK